MKQQELDELFTQVLAALSKEGLITLEAYTHKLISSCGSNAGRPPSSTLLSMAR